jgi:hypothetical protein
VIVSRRATRRGVRVRVRVRVPAAGVLRVRGAGRPRAIRPARVPASAAGIVKLDLRTTRTAGRALARRSRLRIRALFTFTPVGGARQSRIRTVTFSR